MEMTVFQIFFCFLCLYYQLNLLKTSNSFNTKFEPQQKDQKSSYEVR